MQPCSLTDSKVPLAHFALDVAVDIAVEMQSADKFDIAVDPGLRRRSSVSISAFLLGFGLNICFTLGRNIAVRLGFHRHSLRLPDEGLPETVTGISLPL